MWWKQFNYTNAIMLCVLYKNKDRNSPCYFTGFYLFSFWKNIICISKMDSNYINIIMLINRI